MVKEVQNFQEFEESINSGKLVVVDFFATWCGPCRVVAPQFEALSQELTDIEFIKVDVDKIPEAASKAGVSAMPTFALYNSGQKLDEVIGANVRAVREKITKHTA